jgi:hypothetical protein
MSTKKGKCKCKHVGQCPVNDNVHPLSRTYVDGTRVFRVLTDAEKRRSRLQITVNGRTQQLHDAEEGDQVVTDGEGNVSTVAKAFEPKRAIAYARTMINGPKCKGNSFIWRKMHPVPEADTVVLAEQTAARS